MSSISIEDTYRKFRWIVGVVGAPLIVVGAILMVSYAPKLETIQIDPSSLIRPLSGLGLAVLGGLLLQYLRPRTEWQIHMDLPHSAEEELFRGYGKKFAREVERRIKSS